MIISVIFSLFEIGCKGMDISCRKCYQNNHKFIIIAQNPWIVKKIGVFFSDW